MVGTTRLRFPKSRLRLTSKRPKSEKKRTSPSERAGAFITFEGGEGAGKTTLIAHIAQELSLRGFEVVVTREPGGSVLGNKIRELLLGKHVDMAICDKAELLLFLASRAEHLEEVIIPALKLGKIVLCDRFNDSTVAYQGAARKMGVDYVRGLCDQVCGKIQPDLTYYLDVDPKIGLQRASKAVKSDAPLGESDRLESEKLEFHESVRRAFLEMVAHFPERFQLINASRPLKEVFVSALQALDKRLCL